MARVYSTSFIAVSAFTGVESYAVPDGFIAIIRDWDAYVNAGTTDSGNFYLSGGVDQIIDYFTVDFDTTVKHQWQGRQVVGPGENLFITAELTSDHSVSGYLLELP